MLVKVDLSKSYDHLSLKYLQGIVKAFGFDSRWIRWIILMISILVFSILLNVTPIEAFNGTIGLKQGNPISLFLFILVAEGLGRYVKEKVQRDQFTGLRMWGNDLPLTHQ